MAQKGNRQRRKDKKNDNHDVLGISLVIASLFLLLCIVIPPILSVVSKAIFNVMLGVFGIMAYPMLIATLLLGVVLLLRWHPREQLSNKTVACIVLLIFCSMIILQLASTHAFLRQNFTDYIKDIYAAKYSAGGVIFGTIAYGLKTAITEIACYVVFSVAILLTIGAMTNIVERIKARRSRPAPEKVEKPAKTRGFTAEDEAKRVSYVEPQNKLYIGQIARKAEPPAKSPAITTESGKASDMREFEQRRVTDYAPSPIIERDPILYKEPDSSPEAARYALYGDSEAINEREREEFVHKTEEPPVRESVDPHVRVSEDAANATNRPRKIDHDEALDMQVFFPMTKRPDFNDRDDIITADDIKAHVQADIKKRKQTDIESAEVEPERSFVAPDFKTSFAEYEPEIPSFTSTRDDIFDAPVDKKEEKPFSSADDRLLRTLESERAAERESVVSQPEEIIDAAAMNSLFAEESEQESPSFDDDIINGTPSATSGAGDNDLSPIIDGLSSRRSQPVSDVGNIDGLIIADGPAVDLSETRDITSDIIDGGESSGMYVPADEPTPVRASAPKQKHQKNAPLENQMTLGEVMGQRVDSSVVMSESAKRKKYNYAPPPIDLLKIYEKAAASQEELNETAATLERVIGGFLKAEIKVINIVPGPTVTRYELDVPSGISVKGIESRSQDIEYELASPSHIRIEAPIPGKRAVGIEVPNVTKSIVGLREVIESSEFRNAKSPMTVSVGKDISGGTVLCDLVKVPHLLIAGQTGSGKSACLNGLIISLLYKSSPEDLRFILVDPKRVEFSAYRSMPHLLFDGIIYEPNEVLSALKWACMEMERRYALMAKYGRNQLATFNELPDVVSGSIDKLPHIIIIIDELADIMQSAVKRDIEDKIKVIAAKARAAGIHLIVATQRPSADVLTGTIKTNLTSRIAFKVSGQLDSRIILDTQGAEALVGNGDMLFFPVTYTAAQRVQGSYIRDEEVASVITYIKEHFECDFDESAYNAVFSSGSGGVGGVGGENGGDSDSLFPDVLALVIKTGQVSISGVQRRFSIGYNRAARMIDIMEEMGYIGPNTGTSKPRDVYITADKYKELYGHGIEDN